MSAMASSEKIRPADGRVLVTFDVDGTLVKAVGASSNRLHKRAFSHAFKEVFGVDGHIDVIQVCSIASFSCASMMLFI